jgi:histidinol dehydrogenase
MSPLRVLSFGSPTYRADVAALLDHLRTGNLTSSTDPAALDVPGIVSKILDQVRKEGDAAVARLASQLDRAAITPETIRVSEATLRACHQALPQDFLSLVRRAIANIREYQTHIRQSAPPQPLVRGGRKLTVRYTPIERVGVYVPGGRAFYPSTVLMTVVPAQVAGVGTIAMVSPPTDGDINPMALGLAAELGVTEVYRAGGAVGIAALGYGTQSIPAVHKIVGPGNAFVAEAKRQLFGRVGIDSIAGPSEVFIVADDSVRPDWVAADMLAQAEHDPGSAVLATPSASLAQAVVSAVEQQLVGLSRREALKAAMARHSAILVTSNLDEAVDLANAFATEHLQLMTRDDARCLERIVHAGAIFVGAHTPVPLGDYFAGPSHVLPTGGTARFFGPLSCNDFMKASSVVSYDAPSLTEDAADVEDFATREGLTAHAAAVRVRQTP